jgi:hypothetical protein
VTPALALAIDDLLVREDSPESGAKIDRYLRLIRKTLLE